MNRHERRALRASQPVNPGERKHYYLVAGEVVAKTAEGDAVPRRLNAILQLTEKEVTGAALGRAQQQLQLHFYDQMKDSTLQVVDVFLYGLSYLGLMTAEEFTPPKEMAEPTPVASTTDPDTTVLQ